MGLQLEIIGTRKKAAALLSFLRVAWLPTTKQLLVVISARLPRNWFWSILCDVRRENAPIRIIALDRGFDQPSGRPLPSVGGLDQGFAGSVATLKDSFAMSMMIRRVLVCADALVFEEKSCRIFHPTPRQAAGAADYRYSRHGIDHCGGNFRADAIMTSKHAVDGRR